jgi:hypothetical protein
MNHVQFKDEDGQIIYQVQSTVPGVFMVPPGKDLEDAEHISHEEFHKQLQKTDKSGKNKA